jgi:nitroimidazol reductase NimA-like FMN-containing flavoprotein (pyridoxamine 5'-phosphate oxidase superfamily)
MMTREEQIEAILATLKRERFAVFAFAGEPGSPPYTTVMFFAELPDLGLLFATTPGPTKRPFARDGNGACAQFDTRGVGLDRMSEFERITARGYLQQVRDPDTLARHHGTYTEKLPFAKVFLDRPGVETYLLRPTHVVYARGFAERFELELPENEPRG